MTGRDAFTAFAAGYGVALTPAVREVLARYRVLWTVAALSYEHRAGGDVRRLPAAARRRRPAPGRPF